jgi:hypothetical protein
MLHHWLASQDEFSIKWQQVLKASLNSQKNKKLIKKNATQTKTRVQMWFKKKFKKKQNRNLLNFFS